MRPDIEALESRDLCSTVTYHGGQVLQTPRVASLFLGAYRADLDQMAAVVSGDYTAYLGLYGISRGSRDGLAILGDPGPLSDAQVRSYLSYEIAVGALPAPDGRNQMYMVYLDHPVTNGYGTYHWYFDNNGVQVPYGVSYLTDPVGGQGPSHEMAEAITDPFLDGWYAGSPQTGEIADLGHGAEFTLDGLQVVNPVDANGALIRSPTAYVPIPFSATKAYQNLYAQWQYINGLLVQEWNAYSYYAAVGDWADAGVAWQYLTALYPTWASLYWQLQG